MDLATLITEVYGLTNRPDRVAETKSAVKAATLKMHQMDYWDRDIFETGIQFVDSQFVQTWEVVNSFPRFRALKYLRSCDVLGTPITGFNIITPDAAFDSYKSERVNVAYLAGNAIKIKSLAAFQYMLVGIYQNPDITDSGFSSWIAVSHPYAIIFEAARVLFKNIGLDAEAAEYQRLVAEQAQTLIISNTTAKGE